MSRPTTLYESSRQKIQNNVRASVRDLENVLRSSRATRQSALARSTPPGEDLQAALDKIEVLEANVRIANNDSHESLQEVSRLRRVIEESSKAGNDAAQTMKEFHAANNKSKNDELGDASATGRLKGRIADLEKQDDEYQQNIHRLNARNKTLQARLAAVPVQTPTELRSASSIAVSTVDQIQIGHLKGEVERLQSSLDQAKSLNSTLYPNSGAGNAVELERQLKAERETGQMLRGIIMKSQTVDNSRPTVSIIRDVFRRLKVGWKEPTKLSRKITRSPKRQAGFINDK
ncbi:hypothetical protein VTL71DRAFT_2802 [Oculimacula yallundae]|uniref:Uncharacterized protein n=1 Tax=Oculimacula yallundae TaxID=86028 RepID=A0ABR4CAC0_9HELO